MTTRPDHSIAAVQCSRCKLSRVVLLNGVCVKCVLTLRAAEAKRPGQRKQRKGSH